MGFDPQHVLEAQRRLERNRRPKDDRMPVDACPAGEEISKLHVPTKEWLDARGITYNYARTDKESTNTPGVPDFIIAVEPAIFIEYKTKEGKLKPSQKIWHHLAERRGVTVHVFRSMEEFYNLMKEKGIE